MEFLSLSGFLRGEGLVFLEAGWGWSCVFGCSSEPMVGSPAAPLSSVTLGALSLVLGSQMAAASSPAN